MKRGYGNEIGMRSGNVHYVMTRVLNCFSEMAAVVYPVWLRKAED